MKLILILTTIFLGLLGICSAQQPCPPPEVLYPCTCIRPKDTRIDCRNIEGVFNLKEILLNASVHLREDIPLESLTIYRTGIKVIEEDVSIHIKFNLIEIEDNPELVYISPRAFRQGWNTTMYLSMRQNEALNTSDFFEFVNGFKNLRYVRMDWHSIDSIPAHAFQDMPLLYLIDLSWNGISGIGSRAFAGAPSLLKLYLRHNSLPSSELSVDAFDGIANTTEVYLNENGMAYLEQRSYQPLLDQAALVILGRFRGPDSERLNCDQRVNWICENHAKYRNKLELYKCKVGSRYEDIWDYCGMGIKG